MTHYDKASSSEVRKLIPARQTTHVDRWTNKYGLNPDPNVFQTYRQNVYAIPIKFDGHNGFPEGAVGWGQLSSEISSELSQALMMMLYFANDPCIGNKVPCVDPLKQSSTYNQLADLVARKKSSFSKLTKEQLDFIDLHLENQLYFSPHFIKQVKEQVASQKKAQATSPASKEVNNTLSSLPIDQNGVSSLFSNGGNSNTAVKTGLGADDSLMEMDDSQLSLESNALSNDEDEEDSEEQDDVVDSFKKTAQSQYKERLLLRIGRRYLFPAKCNSFEHKKNVRGSEHVTCAPVFEEGVISTFFKEIEEHQKRKQSGQNPASLSSSTHLGSVSKEQLEMVPKVETFLVRIPRESTESGGGYILLLSVNDPSWNISSGIANLKRECAKLLKTRGNNWIRNREWIYCMKKFFYNGTISDNTLSRCAVKFIGKGGDASNQWSFPSFYKNPARWMTIENAEELLGLERGESGIMYNFATRELELPLDYSYVLKRTIWKDEEYMGLSDLAFPGGDTKVDAYFQEKLESIFKNERVDEESFYYKERGYLIKKVNLENQMKLYMPMSTYNLHWVWSTQAREIWKRCIVTKLPLRLQQDIASMGETPNECPFYLSDDEKRQFDEYCAELKSFRYYCMERYKRIWKTERQLSDNMLATIESFEASPDKNMTVKFTLTEDSMSVMGNWFAHFNYLCVYGIGALQPRLLYMYYGLLSGTRLYPGLKFNLILTGTHGIGKSFISDCYKKMGPTIYELRTNASRRAGNNEHGEFDCIAIINEPDGIFQNHRQTEKNQNQVSEWNTRLTENSMTRELSKRVLLDGRLHTVKHKIETPYYDSLVMTQNGEGPGDALADRFHIEPVFDTGVDPSVFSKDEKVASITYKTLRTLTFKLVAANWAIDQGALCAPSMDLCDVVFNEVYNSITREFRADGSSGERVAGTNTHSSKRISLRVKRLAEQMTLIKAVLITFDILEDSPAYNQPEFSVELLKHMEPYMYVSTDILVFVFTLLSNEFIPQDTVKVCEALKDMAHLPKGNLEDTMGKVGDIYCHGKWSVDIFHRRVNADRRASLTSSMIKDSEYPLWAKCRNTEENTGVDQTRFLNLNYIELKGSIAQLSEQIKEKTGLSKEIVESVFKRLKNKKYHPRKYYEEGMLKEQFLQYLLSQDGEKAPVEDNLSRPYIDILRLYGGRNSRGGSSVWICAEMLYHWENSKLINAIFSSVVNQRFKGWNKKYILGFGHQSTQLALAVKELNDVRDNQLQMRNIPSAIYVPRLKTAGESDPVLYAQNDFLQCLEDKKRLKSGEPLQKKLRYPLDKGKDDYKIDMSDHCFITSDVDELQAWVHHIRIGGDPCDWSSVQTPEAIEEAIAAQPSFISDDDFLEDTYLPYPESILNNVNRMKKTEQVRRQNLRKVSVVIDSCLRDPARSSDLKNSGGRKRGRKSSAGKLTKRIKMSNKKVFSGINRSRSSNNILDQQRYSFE